MCIGIPARIISIEGDVLPNAVIDVPGQQRTCCLAYLSEAQVGDYVLIQNGFAMSIVDEQEAQESLRTIAEYKLINYD